jgi:hypothetical protein
MIPAPYRRKKYTLLELFRPKKPVEIQVPPAGEDRAKQPDKTLSDLNEMQQAEDDYIESLKPHV